MSLVTRCTACATMFKVAQEQLRVSDGWVRCGRCDTVFDALESLGQPPSNESHPVDGRTMPSPRSEADDPWHASVDIDALLTRRVEAQVVTPSSPDDDIEDAAAGMPERDRQDGANDGGLVDVDPAAAGTDSATPAPTPVPAPTDVAQPLPAGDSPGPPPRPAFVRQAEREARWHSPAMRVALIGTSAILLLMLLAQVAYHHRDQLAARSPLAADLLGSACARWNCSIAAPRNLGELVIEHSALARVPQRPDGLQLSLRVANRADIELALPTVELSLTDSAGRLIARRALWPSDFGVLAPAVVAPGSELPLQLLFATGGHAVSSYTVELFYP